MATRPAPRTPGAAAARAVKARSTGQAELDDPFEGHRRDSIRWEPWKAQLLRPGQHGPHGPEIRGLRKRRTAGAEAPSR